MGLAGFRVHWIPWVPRAPEHIHSSGVSSWATACICSGRAQAKNPQPSPSTRCTPLTTSPPTSPFSPSSAHAPAAAAVRLPVGAVEGRRLPRAQLKNHRPPDRSVLEMRSTEMRPPVADSDTARTPLLLPPLRPGPLPPPGGGPCCCCCRGLPTVPLPEALPAGGQRHLGSNGGEYQPREDAV